MNRYIPDDMFKIATGAYIKHPLRPEVFDAIHGSMAAASGMESAVSLLKSIGPSPNFMGNEYTKLMATSDLRIGHQLGLSSFAEQAKNPWVASLLCNVDKSIVGTQTAAAMTSWSKSDRVVAAAKASLASNAEKWATPGRAIHDIINAQFEKQFAGIRESMQSVFDNAFKRYSLPSLRTIFFPSNLVDLAPEYTLVKRPGLVGD